MRLTCAIIGLCMLLGCSRDKWPPPMPPVATMPTNDVAGEVHLLAAVACEHKDGGADAERGSFHSITCAKFPARVPPFDVVVRVAFTADQTGPHVMTADVLDDQYAVLCEGMKAEFTILPIAAGFVRNHTVSFQIPVSDVERPTLLRVRVKLDGKTITTVPIEIIAEATPATMRAN